MRIGYYLSAILMALVLAGCGEESNQGEKTSGQEKTAVAEATSAPAAGAFDIGQVPVSTADLGAFPYFARPPGISAMGGEKTLDLGRFPFWTGGKFETVEGRIFMGGLQAEEGKTYSKLAMQKYIEDRVTEAGGVKAGEGRIPMAASDQLGDDVKVGMILGLGDIYNDPTATYVIKRADSSIWIHFVSNDLFGSWTIAEKSN